VDAFGIHKRYSLFSVLVGFVENMQVLKCGNTQKQKYYLKKTTHMASSHSPTEVESPIWP